jgi:hypothetical protein
MRFMIIIKATADSEAGVPPTTEQMLAMVKFNEQLVDAGVLLAADGLHPSSKGARVQVKDGRRTVTDGPFAETKELIAGYWLIQVKSFEEALEWANRVADVGGEASYEIRQAFDPEDFGDAATPEIRDLVDDLHARAKAQHG